MDINVLLFALQLQIIHLQLEVHPSNYDSIQAKALNRSNVTSLI